MVVVDKAPGVAAEAAPDKAPFPVDGDSKAEVFAGPKMPLGMISVVGGGAAEKEGGGEEEEEDEEVGL